MLNGPEATGQHCPEGWTLYPTPGPQMKNVSDPGSADYHYYNWVDQFDANLPCNTPRYEVCPTTDPARSGDPRSGNPMITTA